MRRDEGEIMRRGEKDGREDDDTRGDIRRDEGEIVVEEAIG